ncbi:MAG: hypothetical protein H6924_10240 [Alphaproteobacteria bacterium]|nr:hypothetical protein [Alphaproteobacteria bacterium]
MARTMRNCSALEPSKRASSRATSPRRVPIAWRASAFEQRRLAAEVQIDRALGDTGAGGDIVHPRRGKALFGKTGQGGLKNFRRPFVLAAVPALGSHAELINDWSVIFKQDR